MIERIPPKLSTFPIKFKFLFIFFVLSAHLCFCQSTANNKYGLSLALNLCASSVSFTSEDNSETREGFGFGLALNRTVSEKIEFAGELKYNDFLEKQLHYDRIKKFYIAFGFHIRFLLSESKIVPYIQTGLESYFLNAHRISKYTVTGNRIGQHQVKTAGIPIELGVRNKINNKISLDLSLKVNNLLPNLQYSNYFELQFRTNWNFVK